MTIKKYDKLVRDKIPEIIESQGKQCKVYVAVNDDYQQRLKDKLQEEVQEFLEDPCVEELADIEEVLLSIAEINNWDLTGARITKNFNRGGFRRRFVLQEVSE
jgi:predicted house-cleaning noncanonical NTP pyrophosphatase (MazG superfamily)